MLWARKHHRLGLVTTGSFLPPLFSGPMGLGQWFQLVLESNSCHSSPGSLSKALREQSCSGSRALALEKGVGRKGGRGRPN